MENLIQDLDFDAVAKFYHFGKKIKSFEKKLFSMWQHFKTFFDTFIILLGEFSLL